MITLPHVAALCAALDAGEDTVLPILADALEDAGDSRAATLWRVIREHRLPATQTHLCGPFAGSIVHAWTDDSYDYRGDDCPLVWPERRWQAHVVAVKWRRRMADRLDPHRDRDGREVFYPTRSAAFLALAAALS